MTHSSAPSTPSKIYFFADSANAGSFKLRPLTIAVDELQNAIQRDNFTETTQMVGGNVDLSAADLIAWVYTTLAGPPDKPNELIAFQGFQFGLEELSREFPCVIPLNTALSEIRRSEIYKYVTNTVLDRPLQGRRTVYPEYELALAMGGQQKSYPPTLAAIAVAALLLARLQGRKPDRRLLGKCRISTTEIAAGNIEQAAQPNWSLNAQRKCLRTLKEDFQSFVQKHPKVVSGLGILVPQEPIAQLIANPTKEFNEELRSRWTATADYMKVRDRQGATPLRPVVVSEIGGFIRGAVELGDSVSVVQYFETHFNATPKQIHRIPVLQKGEVPSTFLAIDIETEVMWVGNDWLMKKGAKPQKGTEHLYLETLNFYPVQIPPFIGKVLKRFREELNGQSIDHLGQLLKNANHQPKQNLLGLAGNPGVTVQTLRRASSTNLLQKGHTRAVVAANNCQNGYVSPGRGYYSCISSTMLREATQDFYRGFEWLGGAETLKTAEFYVGSKVTPKPESIQSAFQTIARQVDRASSEFESNPNFSNWLGRHHAVCAYFSLAMETGLCYRNKDAYDFSVQELSVIGANVHINDKRVRPWGGPAVTMPDLVSMVTKAFISHLKNSAPFLLHQAQSNPAAAQIAATLGLINIQADTTPPLVDFDVHGQSVQIGTSHWHKCLPPSFRLVENFARHFWPLAALQGGLNQVHLDYLLRHQLDGGEHETDQDTKSSATVRLELVTVINRVLASLRLEIPAFLRTGNSND